MCCTSAYTSVGMKILVNNEEPSWIDSATIPGTGDPIKKSDQGRVFVYALELITLTFSTIGYGSGAVSKNSNDKALNMLVIVFGFICYAKIRERINSYNHACSVKKEIERVKEDVETFYLEVKEHEKTL